MSIAALIPAVLNSLVENRVWFDATPDVLPKDTYGRIKPFLLLTVVGGKDAEYVDQTMGNRTNVRLQVMAATPSAITSDQLIQQARDALLESDYTVGVYGSPVGTYDAPRKLYGRYQQFSVWIPQ